MNQSPILTTCLLLLLASTGFDCTAKAESNPAIRQPNILWVVTDDQRADSIAAFNRIRLDKPSSGLGQVLSPNVDRLAAMGTTFINTFNQNPGCAPSRTLMHTGRYSHRTGVYGFEYYNPLGQQHWRPMVPEILRDKAGYQTLAVGKLGIRAQHFSNQRGGTEPPLYQTNLGYRKEFAAKGLVDWNKETKWANGKPGPKTETFYFPDGKRLIWPEHSESTPNIRQEIQEQLGLLREYKPGEQQDAGGILAGVNPQPGDRTRDGSFTAALLNHLAHADEQYTDMLDRNQQGPDNNQPLFAYVGFEFPHTPVLPPAEFREKFQNLKYQIPSFTKDELAAFPPQLVKLFKNSQSDHFTDAEKHQMIADYYAFCAYGDSLVGKAVDGFIEFSASQNRPWLILYACGDHGWRLNEHGMVSKFSHYDTDLHNPLIVVSSDKQKFPAGKVIKDFTCFVDMAPTFLTAAGIDISKPEFDYLDGRDLAKTAANEYRPRDYIIAEPTWVIGPRAVIRTKDYKFAMKIRPRGGHTMTAATAGKDFKWAVTADLKDVEPTLFDLRADPDELQNVAFDARYRPALNALREKLQNIVLGDDRVEIAWTKTGTNLPVHHSNFAPGSDDGLLEVPSVAADVAKSPAHGSDANDLDARDGKLELVAAPEEPFPGRIFLINDWDGGDKDNQNAAEELNRNPAIKHNVTVLSDLPDRTPKKVKIDDLVSNANVLADASRKGRIAIAMGAHSRHVLAWLTKLPAESYNFKNVVVVTHSNWNELDGRKGYESNRQTGDPPLIDTHGEDLRRGLYPNLARINDLGITILEIPRTDSGPGGWGGSVAKSTGGSVAIKALDISDLGLVHYLKTGIPQATRVERNAFVSDVMKKPASYADVRDELVARYRQHNRDVPVSTPGSAERPNIIVVFADDISARELPLHGSSVWSPPTGGDTSDVKYRASTPVLDRIAAEGCWIRNAWASVVCSPSRAMMMTGRYAHLHKWWGNKSKGTYVDETGKELTWPLYLSSPMQIGHVAQQAGYATYWAGKTQMAGDLQRFGFDQGCFTPGNLSNRDNPYTDFKHIVRKADGEKQLFNADTNQLVDTYQQHGWYWFPHVRLMNHDGKDFQWWPNTPDSRASFGPATYGPDVELDFIFDFMTKQAAEQEPFFVYHTSHLGHDAFDWLNPNSKSKWPGTPVIRWDGERYIRATPKITGDAGKYETHDTVTPPGIHHHVNYLDYQVWLYQNKLQELGIADNTVFVFCADNGTSGYGKNSTDRQRGTHVPLIISAPGLTKRGQQDALVNMSDFLPTIAQLVGAELPAGYEVNGESLVPFLFGDKPTHREWLYGYKDKAQIIRGSRVMRDGRGKWWNVQQTPDDLISFPQITDWSTVSADHLAERKKLEAILPRFDQQSHGKNAPIESSNSTTAPAARQPWKITFRDSYQERTDIGNRYTTSRGHEDGWSVVDGALIGKQTQDDHGAVIRTALNFDDVDIQFDFRFSGGRSFNFVIDDANETSVHSGHICRATVFPKYLMIRDDKTGSMNLEVRKMRQNKDLNAEDAQALQALLQRTQASAKVAIKQHKWHTLRIRIEGDTMTAFLDDTLLASLESPGFDHATKTKFGFTVNGETIDFDNVIVRQPQ